MKLTQPIKMIFFDIDETLYVKNKSYIPDSVLQVLPRLRTKGIIPAIATGRCFGAFPKALKPLIGEKGFELFVTINGQYNFYQTQIISEYALDHAEIVNCIEKLTALNIVYAVVTPNEIAVSADNPIVREALLPIKEDYIVDPHYHLVEPVMQILAFYPENLDDAVVASGLFLGNLKSIRWHPNGVDILKKSNSKAQGIKDVIAHFGLTLENTMAFGDGLNDVEMFSAVGLSVAMGNAVESLKTQADFVTKHIEEDGILYALENLGVI